MMMFLTLLGSGLLAVAVLSVIVYGTSPRDAARPETRPRAVPALGAPRFFGGDFAAPAARPELPVEAVIAQLERHVRLEQAAAESFLELPTPETLYVPTASRLVH